MKTSKIVDALHYIDEDLVAEAITYRPKEEDVAEEIIKISEANGKETTMKKKGKIAKRTLLVAALIAVLVLGTLTVAVAAFRGSLAESLRSMFKVSGELEEDLLTREDGLLQIIETPAALETSKSQTMENTEIVETVRETIEKEEDIFDQEGDITSVTCNGITVRVVQALVDRYHVNLIFRIEGLGEANKKGVGFRKFEINIDGKAAGSGGGGLEFVGEDYVEYSWSVRPEDYNNEGPGWFLGKQIEIKFTDVDMFLGKEMGSYIIQEGEWNLKWTMQGTVDTNIFMLNHELEPEIIITEVELTPISAVVRYEFLKQTVQGQTANGGVANFIKDPPFILSAILKGGTLLEYIGGMGRDGHVPGSTTEFVSIRALRMLIEPSEVDSLIFRDSNTGKEYIVPLYDK